RSVPGRLRHPWAYGTARGTDVAYCPPSRATCDHVRQPDAPGLHGESAVVPGPGGRAAVVAAAAARLGAAAPGGRTDPSSADSTGFCAGSMFRERVFHLSQLRCDSGHLATSGGRLAAAGGIPVLSQWLRRGATHLCVGG